MTGPAFMLQFGIIYWYWLSKDLVWRLSHRHIKSCWPILTCNLALNAFKPATFHSFGGQRPFQLLQNTSKKGFYLKKVY